MKKRILPLLLALVMLIGLLPLSAFAEETNDVVYLSVYNDGTFVTTSSGKVMAYVPVPMSELEKINLSDYAADSYLYDADNDGNYEITVLHLFIYAQEKLYGGSWSNVQASGSPGSLFFGGGLFGFDANMTYYHNGTYPLDAQLSVDWGFDVGATADHIVLEPGDYVDLSGYSDWGFYSDPEAGFRYFLDESGNVTHSYTASKGEAVRVKLATAKQTWESYSYLTMVMDPEVSNTVCYSQTLLDANAKTATTDENGQAVITPDAAGKWYIWSLGDGVSSPAYAEVTVQDASVSEVTAYWPNFRNSLYNMAITDAKTPTSAATTVEKWVGTYGTGWSNSPSALIIADDALIFMNMSSLKKVDLQTGELLAEGTMSASGGFVIISPTYGDGMIFCPLSGGKIEAFDVETLESKWIFTDTLGGQNNTPITYADGYLYTGFWNGEEKEANYVCVNASTGELVWSKAVAGGFYWAGSTVVGDAVIFGSDDGAGGFEGDSHLFALNRLTGEVISDITLSGMGDQRSTIAYSEEKGRVYFTTKNGYITSAAVDAETGALSDLKSNKVSAQATSTPVVYGDKVYFGAGSGMREGSTAGNFFVVDANSLEYLYEIPLLGYPQGSIMISTAYLEEIGKLYCYTTYNNNPGGLTLIKIDPTKNTADGAELEEIYDAADHSQYCLISPICGPDGTIYYRNDSGYIFALTSNNAYLTGLSADVGSFSEDFASNKLSYELVVPQGTASVTLTPTACEGGTAEAVTVTLENGVATAEFTVTKDGDSRTYTVSVREISSNADLGELKVNESNSYTGKALELSQEFASNSFYYGAFNVGSNRKFDNVWPTAADANATVRVYALSNVQEGKYDAETGLIDVTATNQGHNRYAIYFEDDTKPMAIRIEVTAENGNTANYYLVLSKEAAAEAGATLLESLKPCQHANTEIRNAQDATCTEPGYTGDTYCTDCGAMIASGSAIESLGHSYKNGLCTTCGEADPNYKTAEGDVEIFVTIANKGNVVMLQQKITVTDVNHNGIFDVDDALYAAHETGFEGGAAAGYSSYESQWGMSIGMLWGDTSMCYGYWLNNASCWSLEDVVADGNHLVAFVYTDAAAWSDAYTRFDTFDYAATTAQDLVVKLEKAGYDANWNTVFSAHADATITVYDNSGKALTEGYTVTDNGDGSYAIRINAAGSYYIVAADADPLTVPAVCQVAVTYAEQVPPTGDNSMLSLIVATMSISALAVLCIGKKRAF